MASLPIIRQSERGSFKRCQMQWHWGWDQGWKQKNPRLTAADFGSAIHLALAEWYIPGKTRGRDPIETFSEYWEGQYHTVFTLDDEEQTAKYYDAKELGPKMLTAYLNRYGTDPEWEIISPEQRFAVSIPKPPGIWIGQPDMWPASSKHEAIARLVGTFDLVLRHLPTNDIFILDTKTCQTVDTQYLTLDEQLGTYVSVATFVLRNFGLIGPKESVAGIIYNFLVKKIDDRPRDEFNRARNKPLKKHYLEALEHVPGFPARGKLEDMAQFAVEKGVEVLGDISKSQGDVFHRETLYRTKYEQKLQIQRIGEEVLHMNAIRRGDLPILKTPNKECRFCDFFDVCEAHESGGDYQEFLEMAYERHDPYADHRKGAENSKSSVSNKQKTGVK